MTITKIYKTELTASPLGTTALQKRGKRGYCVRWIHVQVDVSVPLVVN